METTNGNYQSGPRIDGLRSKIDEMIASLQEYGIARQVRFYPMLVMMSNNIKECIRCDYDGIDELMKFLKEDWRVVCIGKDGLESWYLHSEDLEWKATKMRHSNNFL